MTNPCEDMDLCSSTGFRKPCLYETTARHEGVVVEELRCRRCGRTSWQWMRPEIAALARAMEARPAAAPAETAAEEPEPRDYWEAAEAWLRELQAYRVRSLAMVALLDDDRACNLTVTYDAGPFETAMMAGILQMLAGKKYTDINREDGEEDDDEG